MSEPTIAECVRIAAGITGIPELDILSRRQGRGTANARQLAMWLARHTTRHSLPEIGRALERDHTTVLHGIGRVDYLRTASVDWRQWTEKAMEAVA